MKMTKIYSNKPVHLGMSILDFSKFLMYDIHYKYINPLDARRRYTDFAQTSLRAGLRYTVQTARYRTRRKTVYLRHGV